MEKDKRVFFFTAVYACQKVKDFWSAANETIERFSVGVQLEAGGAFSFNFQNPCKIHDNMENNWKVNVGQAKD